MPDDPAIARRPAIDHGRLDAAFELVRHQSLEPHGGYAALGVGRADRMVRTAAFVDGELLDAPRRSMIASLTKPMTATAVMQLVQRGAVDLDEPISSYVREFRPPRAQAAGGTAVTARHLLSHTSGVPNLSDDELVRLPRTATAMLERMCREIPRFAPGTAVAYASDAWYLLSALVERVSGTAFAAHLRQAVLAPLGMHATTFDAREPGPMPLLPRAPVGPLRLTGEEVYGAFADLRMPGGGLWSTVDDVLRFGRAMLGRGALGGSQVLEPSTLDRMVELQTAGILEYGTGRSAHHALGWALPGLDGELAVSRSAFGHMGATGSALIVDPGNDLAIVHLRNAWDAPMHATGEAIDAVVAALTG